MNIVEVPSSVQTIVWDLDGTLLDSFGIYQDCLNEVLHKRNRPPVPESILRDNYHGTIDDSIASALQQMGQTVSTAEIAGIMTDFYTLDNVYIKDVDKHLFEDAVDLAQRAHYAEKRQIVVTNRPHGTDRGNGSPRDLIANSRLHGFVDHIVCGDDSAYRKPHREMLEARFGKNLVSLGETIMIGDQFVDAEFAQNIGCAAILVTRAKRIAHLERLDNWSQFARIVPSLRDVRV